MIEPIDELADTRIRLQQAIDERDALKYELDARSEEFRLAADQEIKQHGNFIINVWLSCLGGKCSPKAHLIDGLAKTTRRLVAIRDSTP